MTKIPEPRGVLDDDPATWPPHERAAHREISDLIGRMDDGSFFDDRDDELPSDHGRE